MDHRRATARAACGLHFDLRLKSKADDATLEDVLEDLVTEIREIPGDFIEKLIESKLLSACAKATGGAE